MKNKLEIKYCPRCKKELAVQKDGKPKKKQRYLCKVCGRQFSERKYPIEVRILAVKFCDIGYSYRKIAKIFGIEKSPNTIRNWTLSNPEYDINYREQIEFLKEYKEICDKIEVLEQCKKAMAYHKLEKEYDTVVEILSTQSFYNSTELRKWTQRKESICDKMKELGKVKYKDYSSGKIIKLRSAVSETVEELEKAKSEIETKTALARDTYDISEIIRVLERLISKD